ncbi:TniQ family protein [Kitasatospora aureofaciens]|nr:TniQ family protein [Kitasatospora aureofaciens]
MVSTGRQHGFEARLTRLTPDEAQALTLRRFSGRDPAVTELLERPGGNQHARMVVPPWLLLRSSRYCPQCPAGDGSDVQDRHGGPWKLHWRLATVFACLEHSVLLEDLCPACHYPSGTYDPTNGRPSWIGCHPPSKATQPIPAAKSIWGHPPISGPPSQAAIGNSPPASTPRSPPVHKRSTPACPSTTASSKSTNPQETPSGRPCGKLSMTTPATCTASDSGQLGFPAGGQLVGSYLAATCHGQ